MTARYTHISQTAIQTPYDCSEAQGSDFKPRGLWFSINGGWETWAGGERNSFLKGNYCYELELGETKFCSIQTAEQLRQFQKRYGRSPLKELEDRMGGSNAVPKELRGVAKRLGLRMGQVDWAAVAKEYDGIVFPVFPVHNRSFEERLKLPIWYDMVDCTSGCIWRPKGVQLTRIKRQNFFKKLEVNNLEM